MALTVEGVQRMLDGPLEKLTLQINGFVMGKGQRIKDAIKAHRGEIIQ